MMGLLNDHEEGEWRGGWWKGGNVGVGGRKLWGRRRYSFSVIDIVGEVDDRNSFVHFAVCTYRPFFA